MPRIAPSSSKGSDTAAGVLLWSLDGVEPDGVNATATYMSNVKFHSKRRGRRVMTVRGTARRTRKGKSAGASISNIPAALEFIRAAGGLENAKSILRTVEEISSMVR